jgi:hypothetical protein
MTRHHVLAFHNHHRPRSGSIALILVLVLTLVVGSFAMSISSRGVHERRSEFQSQSVIVLESAIATAIDAELTGDKSIRLPVDEATNRWIIVEISTSNDQPQYQATLFHNETPGLSIRRNL